MATLRGSFRGSRNRPPAPATRPRFTSGTPNVALSDATTRSQASTSSVPPASAGPSTAAITGLVALALHEAAEPAALRRQARRVAGVDRLEVGAGAEDVALLRPGAGEDADPDLVVLLESVDRRLDALGHIAVDRVAGLRSVDRDDGDVPLEFVVDDHGGARYRQRAVPLRCSAMSRRTQRTSAGGTHPGVRPRWHAARLGCRARRAVPRARRPPPGRHLRPHARRRVPPSRHRRRGLHRPLRRHGCPAVPRCPRAGGPARSMGGVLEQAPAGRPGGAARLGWTPEVALFADAFAGPKQLGPVLDALGARSASRSCSSATRITIGAAPPRCGARSSSPAGTRGPTPRPGDLVASATDRRPAVPVAARGRRHRADVDGRDFSRPCCSSKFERSGLAGSAWSRRGRARRVGASTGGVGCVDRRSTVSLGRCRPARRLASGGIVATAPNTWSREGGGGTGQAGPVLQPSVAARPSGRGTVEDRFAVWRGFGSASTPNSVAICGRRSATRRIAATRSSLGFSGMDCGVTTRRTGAKDSASSTVAHRSGAVSAVSARGGGSGRAASPDLAGNGEPAFGGRELSRSARTTRSSASVDATSVSHADCSSSTRRVNAARS